MHGSIRACHGSYQKRPAGKERPRIAPGLLTAVMHIRLATAEGRIGALYFSCEIGYNLRLNGGKRPVLAENLIDGFR